jgi:hypothetical protein
METHFLNLSYCHKTLLSKVLSFIQGAWLLDKMGYAIERRHSEQRGWTQMPLICLPYDLFSKVICLNYCISSVVELILGPLFSHDP